jgi:hypothetical protein
MTRVYKNQGKVGKMPKFRYTGTAVQALTAIYKQKGIPLDKLLTSDLQEIASALYHEHGSRMSHEQIRIELIKNRENLPVFKPKENKKNKKNNKEEIVESGLTTTGVR